MKPTQFPGVLTPEDFPNLCVFTTVLSLTASSSSKTKFRTYTKSDLNPVRRRLQFEGPTTASAPEDKMIPLALEMTSLDIQDDDVLSPTEESSMRERILAFTDSVQSTAGFYTPYCVISQVVHPLRLVRSQNQLPVLCHSPNFIKARASQNPHWRRLRQV